MISVLAILALLTIMLVAFVSVVTEDRGATQSYTQSLHADQIALSGLDQIVVQLQAEATDSNASILNRSGTNVLYMPINATNAVPQRMVPGALAPIVTMSGTNVYSGAADFAATGNSSTNASLNHRSVSLSRWYKPQFLPSSTIGGFTPPQWIVVTRAGPTNLPAGTTPAEAGLIGPGFTNMSGAVGRYAYIVYDTSGLLDINVAGYPVAAANRAVAKGILPWADLTQLTNGISTIDVDNLVKWRNPSNAVNYAAYLANWSTNGFMNTAAGDTTFLTRQELIKYAQTQNPDLTNALPYLTTFSRELNGPTWGPATNAGGAYQYHNNATNAGVTNPLIFNPRVADTGWTRDNGLLPLAGEPLVKYRFPLDKLALLEKQGSAGLSGTDQADILKYFGLVLAPDSNGLYRHWIYTNPAGGASTTGAAKILTLAQVAALSPGREPDFFELLQAGILSGSLGQRGRGDAVSTTYAGGVWSAGSAPVDPDTNPAYQLIRIGANIIDQWDADSYPTTITFAGENLYGIEDLPYISQKYTKVYQPGGYSTNTPFQIYTYFQLWNPHQWNSANNTSQYPTKFQISPSPKDFYFTAIVDQDSSPASHFYWTGSAWGIHSLFSIYSQVQQFYTGLSQPNIAFSIASSSVPTLYREPGLIVGGAPQVSTLASPIAALTLNPISFPPIGQVASDAPAVTWPAATPTTWYVQIAEYATFRIQYQDSRGSWRTYGTFMGMDDPSVETGMGEGEYYNPKNENNQLYTSSLNGSATFFKSDPRTFRFGAGIFGSADGSSKTATNNVSAGLTPSASSVNVAITVGGPFGVTSGSWSGGPYRMDLWAVNKTGTSILPAANPPPSATLPWYNDLDGVQRYGDAAYSYPANSPLFTASNGGPSRPVILNRPFQSVGELGYAFRDMPWKTVDLFSPNSADAGLLDLFTMSDGPLVAGRVNPNTAPAPVLAALLSGAGANYAGGNTNLSPSLAGSIALQLASTASNAPFLNRADLVSRFMTNGAVGAFSNIKTEREAVVRALAESANTRTWNFLIDVIAQSGSYPATATGLGHFLVTGERRYWLHVAIDRYTGQVVARQLEVVNE